VLKESQIESSKHQDDSDVHHQSFPEVVPEDQGIYSDDDGYHPARKSSVLPLGFIRILRFEVQIASQRFVIFPFLVAAGRT
jgi:hypothetical protein